MAIGDSLVKDQWDIPDGYTVHSQATLDKVRRRLADPAVRFADVPPGRQELARADGCKVKDDAGNVISWEQARNEALTPLHMKCASFATELATLLEANPLPHGIAVSLIGRGTLSGAAAFKQKTAWPWTVFADDRGDLFVALGMYHGISKTGLASPLAAAKSLADRAATALWGHGRTTLLGGEVLLAGDDALWCHRMTEGDGHLGAGALHALMCNAVGAASTGVLSTAEAGQ